MKRILLFAFLAIGIGANAQGVNFTEDFDVAGGGGGVMYFNPVQGFWNSTSGCNNSGAFEITTESASGVFINPAERTSPQFWSGEAVHFTADYKKDADVTGTLSVAIAIQNPTTNQWSITTFPASSKALTVGAITTCDSFDFTIPAGSIDPGEVVAIGLWFARSGGSASTYFRADNYVIEEESPATAPACATFVYPTPGGTSNYSTIKLQWSPTPDASSTSVIVGSTPGGSDVYNNTVLGSVSGVYVTGLEQNTTYYAEVTPTNSAGPAAGCSPMSFTTTTTMGYCAPLGSSAPTLIAPIVSFTFGSNAANTSDPGGTLGTYDPYQDFTNIVYNVAEGTTSVPFTLEGGANTSNQNYWATTMFVDWNNDGDFNDSGESYFNTIPTAIWKQGGPTVPVPIVLTGNLTIPTGVTPGTKTMRVKYNFTSNPGALGAVLNTPLLTACADMINGQAEDYTINVGVMAVSDANKNAISVYPNPFTDVLKISDVKGVKSVTVMDVSGRVVKTMAAASELNLSSLKSGMYIVNLNMEDGSVKSIKAVKK
ncbi:MAG: T9SS type A sorting domain-containing protein [Flavobacteriaceae bacterium]|jgi:hypothetical protein|nr:T9SS type A sorting domain-containing protein [Flavobacteriaceae bacterium]